MRLNLLILFLIVINGKLLAQEVSDYEDYYDSGKLYCRGKIKIVDSTSSVGLGIWTYWYENGEKISEELRIEGGTTKYINCWDGNKIQICRDGNGKFYQTWTDFVADSTVYTIRDSLKQGQYISYIMNSRGIYYKVAEGSYMKGFKEGTVNFFDSTGRMIQTKTYSFGKESGTFTAYYVNGRIKEIGPRIDFSREGEWKYFDPNGKLTKKIFYNENRMEKYSEFYSNGNIKCEGKYVQVYIKPKKITNSGTYQRSRRRANPYHTLKDGIWIYYDLSGKVTKRVKYLKGVITKNGG